MTIVAYSVLDFRYVSDPILAVLITAVLLWYAVKRLRGSFDGYRLRTLLEDTPISSPGNAAAGPVKIWGTARTATEKVTAPFTDEDCLVASYRVEKRLVDDDDKSVRYDTVEGGGFDSEPFYVADDTGRVIVDPSDEPTLDVSVMNQMRYETGHPPSLPPGIRHFSEYYGLSDRLFGGMVNRMGDERLDGWRFTQQTISPGDPVLVYGVAEPDPRVENLVVRRDEDNNVFLLSDRSEEMLLSDRKWTLLVGVIDAVVIALLAVLVLVWFL